MTTPASPRPAAGRPLGQPAAPTGGGPSAPTARRSPRGTSSSTGWCCSTATGAATRVRSTWSCATAGCWSSARSRPGPRRPTARRSRRVTEQKAARLRRLAARWLAEHRLRPDDVRIDLVGVLVPRRGGPRARARPRGGLMAFATARTISLFGCDRPPDRRTGRPRARRGRHRPRRPTGRLDQRGPRPVPRRGHQQRLRVAEHPPGDDPALAGRPAQARSALRPRASRSRCSPPPARCRGRALERVVFVGELTLDGRLRAVPGRAADDDGGPGPRDHLHGGARAAGRGGGAGARHGRDRGAVAAPGRRAPARRGDPRGAAGRAAGQRLAAVLARRPAHRRPGHGRRAGDGRRPLRPRGHRRRRPPPDAERARRARARRRSPSGSRACCPT